MAVDNNNYWRDLIQQCQEEAMKVAIDAQLFVHQQMIPQLYEWESLEDQHAFFSVLDFDRLKQESPLLWKELAPKALNVEESLIAKGLRVQRNAQLQAIQNPPQAGDVMQHLFGDPAVGAPAGGPANKPPGADLAPGMQTPGAQALDQLNDLERKQDQAFKPQVQPSTIFGLRQANQKGYQETTAQGLDNLPMGRNG